MTVIRFPARRSVVIRILREGAAWLVLAGEHGWLFGSREEAREDAAWLSRNLMLPVREIP